MGMLINSEKTKVQHLGKGKRDIQIRIDGKALTQTERFAYLGGTIGSMDGWFRRGFDQENRTGKRVVPKP